MTATLHRHRTSACRELVRAVAAGDDEALAEIRRRHHRVPVAAARRHDLSAADVEHVVQETWRRFAECASEIDDPDRVVGWLWSTASSVARAARGRGDDRSPVGEPRTASPGRHGDQAHAAHRNDLARHDNGTLVVLAQRGCDRAFEELVRRLDSLVGALSHRYRLSSADAADVAQVTFMQLHRCLTALREPERVVGWVATTARHECLRIVGTRRTEPVDPIFLDRDDPRHEVDASDGALSHERVAAVELAMEKVSERSQKLLRLLIWDERSYREIALDLDIPIGSIGPTRERSLQQVGRRPEIRALADDVLAG